MWQYTTAGRVSGIEGDVDRNAFYGSSAEWAKFLATSLPAGNTVIACGVGSPQAPAVCSPPSDSTRPG